MSVSKSTKTSYMWQCFKEVDAVFAKCDICKSKISYKTSTSNIKKHRERRHHTVRLEMSEITPAPQNALVTFEEDITSTSIALPKPLTQTKILNVVRLKSKTEITSKLLQFFTVDLQPFSIVEDKGFREFLTALNPSYDIPTRRVISKSMIPALYEECKHKVREMIRSGEKFCITTDCWTHIMSPKNLN